MNVTGNCQSRDNVNYPTAEQGALAPEAAAAMGEAFDAACEELRDVGHLQLVRKLLPN